MHYPLDKELRILQLNKLPLNPNIYPLFNMFMRLIFSCKSDNAVNVTCLRTPGYKGASLKTYVIEPKDTKEPLPCLVYFHGGAFMLKASGSHYALAKEYAKRLPCKVVYVDYRLAPKHPFPTPAGDCFKTYKWVLQNTDILGINPNKIFVGGDSAGGNLATAVTLMARDKQLPLPAALLLIYPATDRRMNTKSMQEYTDTPVWNAGLNKMMWDAYLPKKPKTHIEYASPIEVTSFAEFPPTYVEVAQYDCLRDEGILLYERFQEEGIPVELHEITNACHGFETAVNSTIMRICMSRRINWLSQFI